MKLLLFAIVIFHCTYSEARTTGIREFERKWFSQDNVTYFVDPYFNENEHFIFGACIIENHDKELNCNITMAKSVMRNSTFTEESCKMNRIAGENSIIHRSLGISTMQMFAGDRILVTGIDTEQRTFTSFMTVTILHLKTCSSIDLTFELTIWPDSFVAQVLPYEDTFDVLVSDNVTCSGARTCRITYDKDGNLISGPVPFTISGHITILTVVPKSQEKGLFILKFESRSPSYTLKYFSPDNKETDLLGIDSSVTQSSLISNSYEKLGFCSPVSNNKPEVDCFQFDPVLQKTIINGTFKLNLEPGEDMKSSRTHNLKTGGLLLMTLVDYGNNIVGNFDSVKLIVTKIIPGGYPKEFITIDGIGAKFDGRYPFPLITENDEEFCFYIIGVTEYDGSPLSSHLSVIVKCVKKDSQENHVPKKRSVFAASWLLARRRAVTSLSRSLRIHKQKMKLIGTKSL